MHIVNFVHNVYTSFLLTIWNYTQRSESNYDQLSRC